ncbi:MULTISPECIES: VCBS repeat-containing protein [unclassified Streptomyces]|uniref:FG-GAP repeat domain-containing protein n=1 Tax=unclassified Streptomyces TaxID=2593676 RepID=UPI00340A4661
MRTSRPGRLAACTALALSAGMLLSGTASADEAPKAPHTAVKPAGPRLTTLPSLSLPQHAKRSAAAAATPLKPRLDLDKDGSGDLLYRAINGKTYMETGKLSQEFANSFGAYKDLVAPGDLDGDGSPELLTVSPTGTLSLYAGAGTGGASYATWTGQGWNAYNKLFAPGDVNGDGKYDLLARTPGGELYLYLGNGSATGDPFASKVRVGGGWQAYDQLVGANDMNGDGVGDVLGRTPGGDLYFYAGTGSAADPLKSRVRVGGGWDSYNQIVPLDDTDNDGLADIATRSPGGRLYLYLADGKGNFKDRITGGPQWNSSVVFASQGGTPAYGKGDLMGRDAKGTLYYYYSLNNGTLSARQQVSGEGGWLGARMGYASSLDADNDPELFEVYENNLYADNAYISGGWGGYNLVVGPGDLNNDGKGDLLTRDGSGTLWLQRGNGEATGFASRLKVGGGWNAYNRIVGAGDLTGDGLTDIVARTGDGKLYLYAGTGSSASPFRARVYVGPGWQQFRNIAAPGDLDGDGRTDLIATNSRGEAFRYSSNGYGGFKSRVKLGDGWNTYNDLF